MYAGLSCNGPRTFIYDFSDPTGRKFTQILNSRNAGGGLMYICDRAYCGGFVTKSIGPSILTSGFGPGVDVSYKSLVFDAYNRTHYLHSASPNEPIALGHHYIFIRSQLNNCH